MTDLTDAEKQLLYNFKQNIDSDDVRIKEKIKQLLLQNRYIVYVLNNQELLEADAEPEDYYGVNILPYYIVAPTQTKVQNFICFEVNYEDLDRYNSSVKKLEIIFHIICEDKNAIDRETGIARHDLLAALIQDQFNFTTYFGSKIKLISDTSRPVDSSYAARTLIFQQITDNNLVKTKYMDGSGYPRLANKDVQTLA